jgi:hypothetical protein
LIGGKYQPDSHMNPDDCIVSSSPADGKSNAVPMHAAARGAQL